VGGGYGGGSEEVARRDPGSGRRTAAHALRPEHAGDRLLPLTAT
jgi:hypothetical protein